MNFPPITGLDGVVIPDHAESLATSPVLLAGTAPGDAETMDMWQYFVEHIDEFEVAKAIVDHFDNCPKDLHSDKIDVDAFALYLRAKITLKRQAVAYATAQAALTKAREQSRGLRSVVQAFCLHLGALRRALLAQPEVLALLAATAVYVVMR
ncbi:hypothetical protein KAK06_16070 [Ideonella sp. 4Y11]|uniref:Uncharacterized protein n=1 Tax=Ideonella aquatica TaxID=2824119 RepID=A0A940YI01_9BURK|nr:hypothetical protein [Ideonella aquatica]MBQ0960470.1 hypothetical protein [Ideonella aquatica]